MVLVRSSPVENSWKLKLDGDTEIKISHDSFFFLIVKTKVRFRGELVVDRVSRDNRCVSPCKSQFKYF